MLQKLPQSPYPQNASERTKVVVDLLDIYRVDNNISPETPLSGAQIADVCRTVTYEAFKIEGIFLQALR